MQMETQSPHLRVRFKSKSNGEESKESIPLPLNQPLCFGRDGLGGFSRIHTWYFEFRASGTANDTACILHALLGLLHIAHHMLHSEHSEH